MNNIKLNLSGICEGCDYADIHMERYVTDIEKNGYLIWCSHEDACKSAVERNSKKTKAE